MYIIRHIFLVNAVYLVRIYLFRSLFFKFICLHIFLQVSITSLLVTSKEVMDTKYVGAFFTLYLVWRNSIFWSIVYTQIYYIIDLQNKCYYYYKTKNSCFYINFKIITLKKFRLCASQKVWLASKPHTVSQHRPELSVASLCTTIFKCSKVFSGHNYILLIFSHSSYRAQLP